MVPLVEINNIIFGCFLFVFLEPSLHVFSYEIVTSGSIILLNLPRHVLSSNSFILKFSFRL
ncbi:hypothetical protein HanIR_Chr05g0217451 [Helianthus annuus]|nr:hypothetical protein HanIR_Chr05g0217451 [Helianthus annuus]